MAEKDQSDISKLLTQGKIGVLPTDTIFGLVGRALDKKVVERIYRVRRRNPSKPFIVLIGDLADLNKFGIKPDKTTLAILKKYWSKDVRPTSIILPIDTGMDSRLRGNDKKRSRDDNTRKKTDRFKYLHRGTKTIAFRLPHKKSLRDLLKKTGPLVAPSANPEGLAPAKNISEAKAYFGNTVDFYISGRGSNRPSRLIEIVGKNVKIIRP